MSYQTTPEIAFPKPLKLQSAISDWTDECIAKFRVPGLWACVVIRGRLEAQVAAGFGNIEEKLPANSTQKLALGSVSKPVTGALLAELISAGHLKWTSSIRDVFPELAAIAKNNTAFDATVEHLFSHTSGLPYAVTKAPQLKGLAPTAWRYETLKEALSDFPAKYLPGEGVTYGIGPMVAVTMAEKVTGKSYETLLSQTLFAPLGMTRSGMLSLDDKEYFDPTPYVLTSEKKIVKGGLQKSRYLPIDPDGGMVVSLEDMSKLVYFLTSLPVPARRKSNLVHAYEYTGVKGAGTFGGWYGSINTILMHSGMTGRGEQCYLNISPKDKSGVFFYCNLTGTQGADVKLDEYGNAILKMARML